MKINLGKYPGPKSKKERKIEVRIDDYDLWGLYETLSLIIHPALVMLKEKKHGSPFTDDVDVPESLRSTSAAPKETEWDTDEFHFDRWDYIMDEMIWAFGQVLTDWESQFHSGEHDISFVPTDESEKFFEMVQGPKDTHVFDKEGYKAHAERMHNGFKLFGKYFNNLWD